jgi:hypothetical protein
MVLSSLLLSLPPLGWMENTQYSDVFLEVSHK